MRWSRGGDVLFLAKATENAGFLHICVGYGGEKLRVDLADKTGELLDGVTLHLADEPILTGLRFFAGLALDRAAAGQRANCKTTRIVWAPAMAEAPLRIRAARSQF